MRTEPDRRVGKATACPPTHACAKTVGTAQMRLCPPYDSGVTRLPDGQIKCASTKSKSSPSCKNILIFRNHKSVYIVSHPASQEGRFAVVTNVDAGCDGRGCAFDERRRSGRRSRVVLTPRRWCQVGGAICWRRWQKSPITGESSKETVKPLRGECRAFPV
jgi:hypothetical protein